MRHLVLMSALIISVGQLCAQNWRFEVGDTWYNWVFKDYVGHLKLADRVSFDIYGVDPAKAIIIGKDNDKNFAGNIKNKIIILDFWDTWCSTCMAKFPEMERLQEQFKDKIQIFLVNSRETKEEIKKRFNDDSRSIVLGKYKLPNLPSIVDVDAMRLDLVFPHRFVPFHVWIDTDQTIKILGPSENTHAAKIQDLIDGKDVFCLQNLSTTPSYSKSYPYFKVLGKTIDPAKSNSFITPYNNEYASYAGGYTDTIIDANLNTVRSTYINQTILNLYVRAFDETFARNSKRLIFQRNSGIWPFLSLYVNDTMRYTDIHKSALHRTDQDFIKSRYCYEQVVPATMTEEKRKAYMLEQLNDYFGKAYDVQGNLEKRTLSYYAVVKLSTARKLSVQAKRTSGLKKSTNGETTDKMFNSSLPSAIRAVLSFNQADILLLDESGLNGKVNIILPSKIESIEELARALKEYDLDVIQRTDEFEFVVIKERGYKLSK